MKKLFLALMLPVALMAAPLTGAAYHDQSTDGGYWETYYVTQKVATTEPRVRYVCDQTPVYYDDMDNYYNDYYGYRHGRNRYETTTYCYYKTEYVKVYKNKKIAKKRWVPYFNNYNNNYDRGYDNGYYDGSNDYPYGRSYDNNTRYSNYSSPYAF